MKTVRLDWRSVIFSIGAAMLLGVWAPRIAVAVGVSPVFGIILAAILSYNLGRWIGKHWPWLITEEDDGKGNGP